MAIVKSNLKSILVFVKHPPGQGPITHSLAMDCIVRLILRLIAHSDRCNQSEGIGKIKRLLDVLCGANLCYLFLLHPYIMINLACISV